MSQDQDEKKVVDLAAARQRQRTVRPDAPGTIKGRKGAAKTPQKAPNRVWVYVQVIVFLAVVAYFMRLCRGGM